MHFSFLISVVVLCCVTSIYTQQCDQPSDMARFDCHPDNYATQQTCEARKCCWRAPFQQKNSTNLDDPGIPGCFYPKDFPTYQVISNQTTDFGQRFHIVKSQITYIQNEILNLTVDLIYETQQRLRIKIYDTNKKRYEVPLGVPVVENKANTSDYDVVVKSNPFSIIVNRKSTGVTLQVLNKPRTILNGIFVYLDSIQVHHHLFLLINLSSFLLDCQVHFYMVLENMNNHY